MINVSINSIPLPLRGHKLHFLINTNYCHRLPAKTPSVSCQFSQFPDSYQLIFCTPVNFLSPVITEILRCFLIFRYSSYYYGQ